MQSHAVELMNAKEQLPDLIAQATRQGEVILTQDGEPVAKIIPIARARAPRQFGSARGEIRMAADFDAPLEDFKDYA